MKTTEETKLRLLLEHILIEDEDIENVIKVIKSSSYDEIDMEETIERVLTH